MVELTFVFSMIWSVCASVDEEGRKKIDSYLREIEGSFPNKVRAPKPAVLFFRNLPVSPILTLFLSLSLPTQLSLFHQWSVSIFVWARGNSKKACNLTHIPSSGHGV